jgi:hypothetical protein
MNLKKAAKPGLECPAPAAGNLREPTHVMTNETYDAKMEQLISEEYAALTPETLRQLDGETIDELVKTAFMERAKAEAERDPELREYLAQQGAQTVVDQCLEEHRPTGSYREDGLFPIGEQCWMVMPKAKREHLVAWSAIEPDPVNLRYIAKRLADWDVTKHATLADLERDLAADGSNA